MVNEKPAKCPNCGATTNQFLHGWNEDYTEYRCDHCGKNYKIEKDEADGN